MALTTSRAVRRGVPGASSPEVRRRMQATGRRDTAPELALRRYLHGVGLRFFVDRAPLQGTRRRADVVFPRARVAVYVDGCYWHGCPRHASRPKANAEWWRLKIEANRARDRRSERQLRRAGWTVIRVWAHVDPSRAGARIASVLRTKLSEVR